MFNSKSTAFFCSLLFTTFTYAKVIQIIHTNDLHSHFQGTRNGLGGYAQLKEVIDKLKDEAHVKGIPVLYLDGGDFGEGSSFYFSNQGVDSLRALDLLGVDAVVLGNHDFMFGGKELKHQMQEANFKAHLLSANLRGKPLLGLKKLLKDYVDYSFDDIKVRIIGLTTNELHYMYPIRPLGLIKSPIKVGVKEAEKAKKEGVDFTIALTHIGLSNDIKLIEKSSAIDLVIGGHSHTLLDRPQLTLNPEGKLIPIVQAGAHSAYVGSMILDIQKNGEIKMIDYKMIQINKEMPQDEEMKKFVADAYQSRKTYFKGRAWDEVIGYSEIPLSGNINGQTTQTGTCWSRHLAKMTREVAGTELGLQFDVFQGEMIPPGPITFGDIVDNFPRVRKWGEGSWVISKAKMSGFVLKKIIDILSTSELGLQVTIDGLVMRDKKSGKLKSFDHRMHAPQSVLLTGEELSPVRYYTIALPSEIPYGVLKIINILGLNILHNLKKVDDSDYWDLIEKYIKTNSPLTCLDE